MRTKSANEGNVSRCIVLTLEILSANSSKKKRKRKDDEPISGAIWNVVRKRGGEEGLVPVIINREIGVIRIFALEGGRGGRRDDRFLYNMGCFAKFLRYSKRLSTKEF